MDHLEKQQRKIHPKDRNNVVSNIFFLYASTLTLMIEFIFLLIFSFALKLYRKGFKKDLEESDLYEVLLNYRSKKLGDELEEEWEKQKKKRTNLSIVRLLWSCYGFSYLLLGLMQLFMNVAEIIVIPYALGKLISYFAPGQTDLTKADAYFYATVLIGFNFFQRIYKHNYYLLLMSFGLKIRTAFCSFMYRKALKLSPAHLGDISIGKIVTLITKDVQTFDPFVDFGNDIWIGFIKTIVVSYLLYRRIGVAALTGVGFFLVVMPLQIYLGTRVTSLKMSMCKKTDERLQITQETLSAIRIIKMYTWEKVFDNKISAARKKEVHTTYKIFFIRFLILVIGSLNSYIAFYLILITYIKLGNNITAEIVYFILSTFQGMSYGLSILFPIGIYQTAELKSTIKRVGYILKAMELQSEEPRDEITILPKIHLKNVTVSIKNQKILQDISLTVEKGLTLITGSVGSGKSFLLKTILRDYKPEEGNLVIQGNISYSSQEPWLFPSSIRQNIVFGEKYDEKRYQEVLKVCALIYDFELLEDGDNTIVEDRGINLSKGQQCRINLARAIYKESDIYLLDDSLAALDAHVSAFIFKECITKFLRDKLVLLVTHNINYAKDADKVIIMDHGKIKMDVKSSELNEKEFFGAYDNNKEKEPSRNSETDDEEDSTNEETKLITETTTEKKVYQENKKSGDVDSKVYKKYIKLGGGFIAFIMVFCVFVSAQLSISYTDKLKVFRVNLEEKIFNQTTDNSTNSTMDNELVQQRTTMFYLYSAMTIATAVTTLGRAIAILFFARRASIRLHKTMIMSIINGAMQFFDTNFIGNILNRFSKDLTTLDETVPFVFYHVFRVLLILIGIVTLIASVNKMFLIPAVVFFIILVILRRYCLRTARSLKRLDATTRSPVVGHLNATLEGLTTIRAFKAEQILKNEFDRHQDLYTSANYILQSSMRAFAFTLDTLCGFFIALIVIRFLVNEDDTLAGHVGLAITQAFMLTGTLQWGIRQWAEVENQMTSVERVLEYTEVKQESKQGLELDNWPKRGEVKYENVFLTYTNSNEQVLKNINFTAQSQEKIGIVGRTGAGKSSIISTLFRLYEVEGKITIDGVDTKTLSLDFLRSNISIIPQDPVLFSGTIRENIDPTRTRTDEEIWKAVESAHLKKLVPSLDFEIVESGSNFSIGQKQLICLARAIIRNNKIIVLDEATANMDPETDALIHQTIKENFFSCTVFTIAHKLHSILTSDKVMVLDKGQIIEYDEPMNLLENKNGIFYKMFKKDLEEGDLYEVLSDYRSQQLSNQLKKNEKSKRKIAQIYHKTLKLSPAQLGDLSIGKIVTLITKDVQAIEIFVNFGNDIWVGLIKSIVVFCFFCKRIGTVALTGLAFCSLILWLQIYLGTKVISLKMKSCEKTEERLQISQGTLSAIKIIKMYTWERIFGAKISTARRNEVHTTYKMFFIKSIILVIGSLNSYIGLYILLMTYIKLGNGITAEIVYFTHGLAIIFPIAICQTAELKSAVKRIGSILKAIELPPKGNKANTTIFPKVELKNATVVIKNKKILQDITLKVEKGLTLVRGPVGCGKSLFSGQHILCLKGIVAFSLINILFGEKYDQKRYQEVLRVCALIYDFELLKEGDRTIVEDRGINLSRGLQIRINLARGIYKKSEMYLLDDSLSALDGSVSAYIFEEGIKKFLQDKLVILVTHNLSYLKDADRKYDENSINKNTKFNTKATAEKEVYHENKKSGEVDLKVYKRYIKLGCGNIAFCTVFSVFTSVEVAVRYSDKLVSERTVRSLKRLDALNKNQIKNFSKLIVNAARSPVVGHVNATLEGLTTIRAFKTETILTNEFDRQQDLYNLANYILQSSMRVFGFALESLSVFVVAIIIIRFLAIKNDILTGNVGLALTQTFLMTGTLQYAIRVWTDFESQMTSMERVLEYTEIKQERKQGLELENWPKRGEITCENVRLSYRAIQNVIMDRNWIARYNNSNEYILKNINFAVKPREKIEIVCRTGDGKSSIISTLFRLYEVEEKIIIDTKILSLDFLRSTISIIPQDPILFSGTIRGYIDPTKTYTDEEIWKAVESVHFKSLVSSLDTETVESGSNFGIGQKQLICLARAVIRKNVIIILDEATANMDLDIETLIHQTIKDNFASCTVLTIAHKLCSVLNSDRIIVMNKGEIIRVYKHNYLLGLTGLGIKTRTAFCSFIYRKTLKLSPAQLGDISIGRIVTLITKDVDAFGAFIDYGNDLWVSIVKTIAVTYFLYRRIGVAALAALGFFLITMPLQKLLEDGDSTIVEDRGINLSKGQQVRINLARAVYKESQIYLLDDSLAALDAHKFLRDKLVVLITHNKNYLPDADKIVIIDEGKIKLDAKSEEVNELGLLRNDNKRSSDKMFKAADINNEDSINTLAGDVGLAISQAFMLTGSLEWGIRQWAEIENQMTSVERVLEYTEIKQENKQGLELENWPKYGGVKYENVYLTYTNSKERILKNINFIATPQAKIGIVGRTGSGKSSIISALLRLYDIEGRITIDGVDIKTLSLDFLRSTISLIPQDPVLFSGTIRDNIDPTRTYTDDEIWKAVKTANLKKLVPSLDFEIVEGGSNFSIGQRQLICLARAAIRKNKIIVMDEATANMDSETDTLIHQTIKENVVSCTVFTIAHKLHSVLKSDKVMVLEKGEIIEYGNPANLLENKNGAFYKMVAKADYALKIFRKGFKRDLEESDLYEVLPDYRSKKLGDHLEQEWEKQKEKRKKLSIFRLLWSCYGLSYISLGCMQLFMDIVELIVQPYALAKLVSYFSPGQTNLTKNDAYFYAVVLIGFNFFSRVYKHNYLLSITGLGIKIRTAFCSFIIPWNKNYILEDESILTIKRGLTLVTGPVGSGKSFLLKTILQDYKPENGTLLIEGNISYASQDPWLFPSSIKQNILFGEKYNEKRYQEVLKACALIYDLQLLEDGDNTIVEDRGFNLSKGQQVRINLARALYKDTEIYLLDDPLVALDAHAEGKITIDGVDIKTLSLDILRTNISIIPQDPVMFSGTIRDNVDPTGTYTDGEIWNAIENTDKVMVLDNGEIVEYDEPENLLQNQEGIFYKMKGFQQELEEEDLYEVPSHFKSKKLRNNLEQNWNQESKHFKESSIFRLLLRSYGFCYFVLGLIKLLANTLLIIIQPYIVMRTALDSFIYSKVLKSNYLDDISVGKIITLITKDTQTFENFVHYGNELWIGIVKLAVIGYILYIKIGPAALVGVGFLLVIIPIQESLSTFFPIAVYQTSETIAATKRISKLIKIKETQACDKKNYTKHAMINLHNVTVTINNKQILQEINLKFEKGLTVITGAVGSGKTSLLRTILCDFQASDGVLTVDGSISYAPQEPWFFPSSIRQNILFGEKYNEKHYYEVLKVCALLDDFELLDDGDLTIIKDHGINLSTGQQYRINLARAIYKQSDIYLLDGCLSALDSHVSDYIFRKCILSFLGDKLVILVSHRNDFIKTANNLVVLHDGKVELATKSAEEDTDTLTKNIKQNFAEELNNDKIPAKHDEDITENTHLLGANDNERKVYQEEKKSGKVDLSVYKEFIKSARSPVIEHLNATLEGLTTIKAFKVEEILKDEFHRHKLNFVLKPEEKIGIVSRTGAGKSSIISVLFRLYETEGMITIDGVDIKTLSLQYLRSKISVVPQDPFLFTGTIRDNIDPLGKYTDQEMWRICERANMKSFVSNLDSEVASSASNFSRGQKQL
ncbi:multidrug resistance-associated protein 4-like, partial [Asbolus verrucosus]